MNFKFILFTLLLTIVNPVFSQHYVVPFWQTDVNSRFDEKLFGLKDEKGKELIAPKYRSLHYIGNQFFNAQTDSISILLLGQREIVKNDTFTRFYQHLGNINDYNQESVIGYDSTKDILYDLNGKVSNMPVYEKIKILYSIDGKQVIMTEEKGQTTFFVLVNNKIVFSESSSNDYAQIEKFTFDTIIKLGKDVSKEANTSNYNYFSLNKLRMLSLEDLLTYAQVEQNNLNNENHGDKINWDKEIRMIREISIYNLTTHKTKVVEKKVIYGKPKSSTHSLDKLYELLVSQKYANKLDALNLHKVEIEFLESKMIKNQLLLSRYDSIDYKQLFFNRNSFSSEYLFNNRKNKYQVYTIYKNGKIGLVTKKGKVIIEPEYDLINFSSSTNTVLYAGLNGVLREDAYYTIKKNELYGVIKLAYDSSIDDYTIVYLLQPIFKHIPLFYYDNYYGIDKLKIFALRDEDKPEIIHFANEEGLLY